MTKKHIEILILSHFILYTLLIVLISINFCNIRYMYSAGLCMREMAGVCEMVLGALDNYDESYFFPRVLLDVLSYLSQFFR